MNSEETVVIRIKKNSRYLLKLLAAKKDRSMIDLLDELVKERCISENVEIPDEKK